MKSLFPTADQLGHHTIFGNIGITTLAGEHMQLSLVDMPANSVVEWHSHPNEQMGMVISGSALFQLGDEEKVLKAGDMYCIPGGMRHRVVAMDGPPRILDVFYPIRDEYR